VNSLELFKGKIEKLTEFLKQNWLILVDKLNRSIKKLNRLIKKLEWTNRLLVELHLPPILRAIVVALMLLLSMYVT